MLPKLQIGTRKSELARTQTQIVIKKLNSLGYESEEHHIVTKGDVDKRALIELSGDGFFTKELENALTDKRIDLAVHSSKDLPSMPHKYLPWIAFEEREDDSDILICKPQFQDLPPGTRVGTSSPRRRAQLLQAFPQIEIIDIRGNVPTRIEKSLNGTVDAVVLAAAGVNRLNLYGSLKTNGLIAKKLPFTTAPGQGILAVQGHFEHLHILEKILNADLDVILKAEKSLLTLFGGGCHLAMGVHIKKEALYRLKFFLKDETDIHNFEISGERLGDFIREAYINTLTKKPNENRVWLTQPMQHQLSVAKKLVENGFTPISWPLIEIQSLFNSESIKNLNLNDYAGVVFSSQFGGEFFFREVFNFENTKFYAVGESTANLLKKLGLDVAIPEEATAEHLADILPPSSKPYLIPGTPMTRLAEHLKNRKIPHKILPLYESTRSKSNLRVDVPEPLPTDKIVLTSPSAANEFIVECASNIRLRNLKVFAMGPSTSKALTEQGIKHTTSTESGSWDALISQLK